jgi:hypothetical protein
MTYRDGGGILLVTDGPLTSEEWERLHKYVTDVLKPERQLCYQERDGLQCHLDHGHKEPHRADGVGRILNW